MKQVCITIMLAMFMSMGGVMANGQVQRSINVATAGMLSDLISEDEKYQIEELTLSGELNGDDIFLIREMAGINMDNMSDYKYLGKGCLTAGKLRVLDLSDARIVEGGREYYKEKIGSVSFTGFTYTTNDEISANMFTYCTKLEELILPKSAKVISPRMMYGDASDRPKMNIKVLKVADGNPNYDSRDYCNAVVETATNTLVVGCNGSTIPDGVTSIGDYAFADCSGMTSVIIPNSVTTIGDYAFYNCSSLTSVIIPSSVTSISEFRAFYNCRGLESVTVHHTTPLAIYNGTFSWWDRDNYTDQKTSATLYVPVGTKTLYEAADGWKEFKNIAEDESIKVSPYKVGDKFIFDGVTYKVTSIDPLEVQVGNGDSSFGSIAIENSIEGAFEIPASVTAIDGNTYSVTAISKSAFSGCSGMTSVTIPSSVVTIAGGFDFGGSAFVGGAFENCGLTTLIIPSSVTSIGGGAFAGCSNLVSIVVEEGNAVYDSRDNCNAIIEKENNRLIAGCKNTKIPDGLIGITVGAFFGCKGLTSMDIPNSVTYISDYAFYGCNELTSLNISENVTSIGTQAFAYCSGLTSVTIPESVKTIWHDAFYGCSGLVSASILSKSMNRFGPHTYTDRYVGVFGKCDNLTTVTVCSEEPFDIGGSFLDNSANATLYVPKGSIEAYAAAEYWKDFKEIKEIGSDNIVFADAAVKALCVANWDTDGDGELNYGEAAAVKGRLGGVFSNNKEIISFNEFEYFTGVSTLGYEEFSGCSSLTSVIIPNSVTSLGFYAFQDCSSLTSIEIPNTVISIESGAFRNCKGLTSIEIPNSVTTIYFGAFQNCSSLTSITIPNSVTGIGQLVFSGCDNLSSLAVELGNTKYDSRDNCNAIIETESNTLIIGCNKTKIPNSVVSIDSYSFQSCKGMTSIEIPNNVTRIGDSAFGSCSSLTSVTIPKNVINIGKNLFSGCENLSSIVVESGNTGYDSRNDCNAIIETESNTLIAGCNKTKIPNSVTKIGEWAFSGCNGLTSITIPNSVTSIGEYAFAGCFDLTEVIINISKPLVLSSQFDFANSANATLYVPKGCVEAYASADNWKEFKEIVEISPGDADGDGNVDQKDVNLVVEYIMNGKTEDLNLINATGSDRKVLNVADIVRIINIMKNK